MASPHEPSSSRRRLGRRRLPPLEPGPTLQFVVANHPDQFRAGKTMRHVRSHVMYKHQTERKTASTARPGTALQRSASACASSTASPATTGSDTTAADVDCLVSPQSRPRSGTWSGSPPSEYPTYEILPSALRSLIYQILRWTQGAYARSNPPVFEDASSFPFPGLRSSHRDSLGSLKQHYVDNTDFFCQDKHWMQAICADQMSFLSHVSVSSVYQDLADGLWQDSGTTVQIKTHALSTIAGQLESNDVTILSILHLLLSEVGGDEAAFNVHYQGLQGLIHRRGGSSQLPYRLATYVTLHLTALAVLKPLPESSPRAVTNLTHRHTLQHYPYISPLYAPHGEFASLSTICSAQTVEILYDVYTLTQAFTHQSHRNSTISSVSHHNQAYGRVYRSPSIQSSDWVHESIRLTALIHTHAILHRNTFADSANALHQDPTTGTTTLTSLLNAIEHTDVTSCWGDMRGVFLWVCLIGGAASWQSSDLAVHTVSPSMAWARKCFSLWAVRAIVGVGFEYANEMMEGLQVGLSVRKLLDGRGS